MTLPLLKPNLDQLRKTIEQGASYFVVLPAKDFLTLTISKETTQEIIDSRTSIPLEEIDRSKYSRLQLLRIDPINNKVLSHDGRHRSSALMKAGGKYLGIAVYMGKKNPNFTKADRKAGKTNFLLYRNNPDTDRAWEVRDFPKTLINQTMSEVSVSTRTWLVKPIAEMAKYVK